MPVSAQGKHVVIIGGGDTGADCLGTAIRQGAASVTQLEILPRPPEARPDANPWPTWPLIYRTSSAHEEGCERVYAVSTTRFVGGDAGQVRALELVDVELVDGRFAPVEGSEREIPADLVLLAMGFTGPAPEGLLAQLGVELDARGNVARDASYASTVPGVFVAGDAGRGPVADRLGHRRGSLCRRGGGCVARGRDDTAEGDRSDGAPGQRLSLPLGHTLA